MNAESHAVEGAFAEAQSQLDSEEEKVENAISEVSVQVQYSSYTVLTL